MCIYVCVCVYPPGCHMLSDGLWPRRCYIYLYMYLFISLSYYIYIGLSR